MPDKPFDETKLRLIEEPTLAESMIAKLIEQAAEISRMEIDLESTRYRLRSIGKDLESASKLNQSLTEENLNFHQEVIGLRDRLLDKEPEGSLRAGKVEFSGFEPLF